MPAQMQLEFSAELFTKKDKRMQPGFLSAAAFLLILPGLGRSELSLYFFFFRITITAPAAMHAAASTAVQGRRLL